MDTAVTTRGRTLPLDDLRAAVPRRDDQLRRSAGDRHPQADAAGGVRVVRDRLRRHRLRVPAGVCDRLPVRGPHHGPARHQEGILARADRLVARGDGDRGGDAVRAGRGVRARRLRPGVLVVGGGLHVRAVPARPRRSGQLPGGDQDRGRMVPAPRARVCDRPVQRRHEHRRGDHADGGAGDHRGLRLVLGVRDHRLSRVRVARALVGALRQAGRASARRRRRARADHQRSAGEHRARAVGAA